MFLLDKDKNILAKQVGPVTAEILSQIEGLEETVPYFAPDVKRKAPRTTIEFRHGSK